jgi:O-antigen/teichoic acid export membrane protein
MYLPLVMGLGIAAPRYIAIARAGAIEGYTESAFATATLTAGLLPPLTLALLFNLAPQTGAALLFGRQSYFYLVPPATIALAGISLHAMVYAVYRGRSEMRFANVLQIANLALAPLIGFAVGENSAASVLTATGVTWLLISGVALIHVLYRERADWRGLASMREHLKVLLRFGLPRVPGEFALVGLFAIPSLLAVRAHGIVEAGQFSAALSVLTMAAGTFAPVGLVVLPRASAMVATGDIAGVKRLVRRILIGGILVAAGGVVIGELVIPFFIKWYFGEAFVPAIPYFRAVLLATIPYAVYILMRSILDALDVRALNSRNLIVTVSIVTILCLVNRSIIWMAGSIVGSLVLLSVLTLRDVRSRLVTA